MVSSYQEVVTKVMELVAALQCHKILLNKDFKVNYHSTGEISLRQQQILMFIIKFNRKTVKEMSEDMAISPSALSIMLKKLVNSGYIVREEDINDKRNVLFNATDEGLLIYNKFRELIRDIMRKIYESHSEKEKAELFEGFLCLHSSFDVFTAIPLTEENLFDEVFNFLLFVAYQSRRYGVLHNIKDICPVSEISLQIMDFMHNKDADTIKKLVHILGLSKSTLSITVKNLEAMGYVKKTYGNDSNMNDNRFIKLTLTEEGIMCLEQVYDRLVQFYYGLWQTIPKKRQDMIANGINRIHHAMLKNTISEMNYSATFAKSGNVSIPTLGSPFRDNKTLS